MFFKKRKKENQEHGSMRERAVFKERLLFPENWSRTALTTGRKGVLLRGVYHRKVRGAGLSITCCKKHCAVKCPYPHLEGYFSVHEINRGKRSQMYFLPHSLQVSSRNLDFEEQPLPLLLDLPMSHSTALCTLPAPAQL